ncbi:hypothetical protein AAFC00_001651 [Neodothiora populina]|uniref:Uncharacterized protein n=1 Tax=Neodothiora populina TaxID=2781224 RepID=A0ABR3PPV2_9PEZI
MKAIITADPLKTRNYQNAEILLAAFTLLRAADEYANNHSTWENSRPAAMECGLKLCLKAINATVTQTKLMEVMLNTTSKKIKQSYLVVADYEPTDTAGHVSLDENSAYQTQYSQRDDFQLDASSFNQSWIHPDTTYNVSQVFIDSSIAFLINTFGQKGALVWGGPMFEHDYLQPLYSSQNWTAAFESVANSLTNVLQNSGQSPLEGVAMNWTTKYHIRWAFMTLPAVVMLSGIIFTTFSIIETRRQQIPAWKTNALAAIAYGADEATRKQLRAACMTEKLDKAGYMTVQMMAGTDAVELATSPPLVPPSSSPHKFGKLFEMENLWKRRKHTKPEQLQQERSRNTGQDVTFGNAADPTLTTPCTPSPSLPQFEFESHHDGADDTLIGEADGYSLRNGNNARGYRRL